MLGKGWGLLIWMGSSWEFMTIWYYMWCKSPVLCGNIVWIAGKETTESVWSLITHQTTTIYIYSDIFLIVDHMFFFTTLVRVTRVGPEDVANDIPLIGCKQIGRMLGSSWWGLRAASTLIGKWWILFFFELFNFGWWLQFLFNVHPDPWERWI